MHLVLCEKVDGHCGQVDLQESCNNEDEWIDKNANYQFFFISTIDNKLMRRLVNCHTFNEMWHCLYIVHEQNVTKNVQLLQATIFQDANEAKC